VTNHSTANQSGRKKLTNATSLFLLALVAIIVFGYFGYKVGKDMALRDNARDAAAAQR